MEQGSLIRLLSDTSVGSRSELIGSSSDIHLTLAEYGAKRPIDLKFSSMDVVSYLWNPYMQGGPVFSVDDASAFADPSTLFVGPPFTHPFKNLRDIKWKATTSNKSGVVTSVYVTNPLFIYDNDIKFYNTYDSSSNFILSGTDFTVLLENASLKDFNNNDWLSSDQYSVYPDPCTSYYVMESSMGVVYRFDGYVELTVDASSKFWYGVNDLYGVPLMVGSNLKYRDASNNEDRLVGPFIFDIRDGKIGFSDPSGYVSEYINFNYDSSTVEQAITLDVTYESDRMPLYVIDPSVYYWNGQNDPSVLTVDNSTYTMSVNNSGDYYIESYGWDSFNNSYYNRASFVHRVWMKSPIIGAATTCAQSSSIHAVSTLSASDINDIISKQPHPIYDRAYPLTGLKVHGDASLWITIPSITYFQDVPRPDSIDRFYNLTEKVLAVNGNTITVDPLFQDFYVGDSISIVTYDNGMYDFISDMDASVLSRTGNDMLLSSVPSQYVPGASTGIYVINSSMRPVMDVTNFPDSSTSYVTVPSYHFGEGQLVTVVVNDSFTGYSWGASYRVLESDVTGITLDFMIPEKFIGDPRYSMYVKHAFTSFSTTDIRTVNAYELDNTFTIYLDDKYREVWYLDDTFAMLNVPFDFSYVNEWWGTSGTIVDASVYVDPIIVCKDTMVVLESYFDVSSYMPDKKCIWTILKSDTKDTVLRVLNDTVPFTFDDTGDYDVQVECYDGYGNITKTMSEGLIKVV